MESNIQSAMADFFSARGSFEGRKNYYDDPKGEYVNVFRPYLKALNTDEQRLLIRFLCRIVVDKESEFEKWRSDADRLLIGLTYPWPDDNRTLLVFGRDILLNAFNDDVNLTFWCSWESQSSLISWHNGPLRAAILYSILLIVATDLELEHAVSRLRLARDSRLRRAIVRRPRLLEAIRLTSGRKLSEEEYRMEYVAISRELGEIDV